MRVLNVPQQLDYEWGAPNGNTATVGLAFFQEIHSMMENHPSVKSYTANDFATTKAFVSPPASQVTFKNYTPFILATDADSMTAAFTHSAMAGPMNVIILMFSATATTNNYDLCIHSQDAARFPCNTLYSALANEPPIASQAHFEGSVRNAQAQAGIGHTFRDRDTMG